VRPLSYCYSLDFADIVAAVTEDFERWLYYELGHGGVSQLRVDFKIAEVVGRYAPTSPRQLLELALQCEELLDVDISNPVFEHRDADAYDALRLAVGHYLAGELAAIWEGSEDERRRAEVGPFVVAAEARDGDDADSSDRDDGRGGFGGINGARPADFAND
jgi:hypothetical protein